MAEQPQHLTALEQANVLRNRRAEEHRRIKVLSGDEGRVALAELLEDVPEWLEGEPIGRALRWVRRIDRALMLKALNAVAWRTSADAIALEVKRIGDMTERQRAVLIAWLRRPRRNRTRGR